MSRHSIQIVDTIEYQRENNIHAVLTFGEQSGGRQIKYNADDNEYYVNGHLLERGDIIARDHNGFLRLAKATVGSQPSVEAGGSMNPNPPIEGDEK